MMCGSQCAKGAVLLLAVVVALQPLGVCLRASAPAFLGHQSASTFFRTRPATRMAEKGAELVPLAQLRFMPFHPLLPPFAVA